MTNSIIKLIKEHEDINNVDIAKIQGIYAILLQRDTLIGAFHLLNNVDMQNFLKVLEYCNENDIHVTVSNKNYGDS